MNPCRVGSATFCSMAKVHNITCGQQSCQLGYSPIHHRKDISSLNDQPFQPDHSYHLSSSHCTEEYIQAPSSGSSIHITWPLLVVKQKLCYIATAECWWLCKDFFQVETSTQTRRCLRRAAHCQDRRSNTHGHMCGWKKTKSTVIPCFTWFSIMLFSIMEFSIMRFFDFV